MSKHPSTAVRVWRSGGLVSVVARRNELVFIANLAAWKIEAPPVGLRAQVQEAPDRAPPEDIFTHAVEEQ